MKTVKKTKRNEKRATGAAEYLRLPYSRIVVADDGAYRAEILEFPGCVAIGDTDIDALKSLSEVAESWIEAALEMGQEIPPPLESSQGYSGKLVLRMPRSLHRKAALVAQREGVSLNQLIVNGLAEHIGAKTARHVAPSATVTVFMSTPTQPARTKGQATYLPAPGHSGAMIWRSLDERNYA